MNVFTQSSVTWMIQRELRERAGSQERLCDFPGDTIFSGHKDQGPMDQNCHTMYMQFAVFLQYSISRVSMV